MGGVRSKGRKVPGGSLFSDVNTLRPKANGVMIQDDVLLELSGHRGGGPNPNPKRLPVVGGERKRPREVPREVGEKRRAEVPRKSGEEKKPCSMYQEKGASE